MIEVKNLVKKYGEHLAVDGLNFTIEKGKIYGFLGPNGAGKSTTMNMITGYIASTEGEIFIDGHSILEEPEQAKKCIGYLPEQPPVYADMTVIEYMKFVAELKEIPKDKREFEIQQVMQQVKIADMSQRLIKNLSKGYRQRVGLAQAILGYPEVIILDEPTVGLDPKQIIEIRDLIKSLKEKHTVILSSHILSEVSALCDYILIISHGKLVASDTPDHLSQLALGSNTLELTVQGERDEVEDSVKTLENLEEYQVSQSKEEEHALDIMIKTSEGQDIREDLFYMMADKRCPILKMQMKKVSLESIFLELTEEQPVTEAKRREKRSIFRKKEEGFFAKKELEDLESGQDQSEEEKEGEEHVGDL